MSSSEDPSIDNELPLLGPDICTNCGVEQKAGGFEFCARCLTEVIERHKQTVAAANDTEAKKKQNRNAQLVDDLETALQNSNLKDKEQDFFLELIPEIIRDDGVEILETIRGYKMSNHVKNKGRKIDTMMAGLIHLLYGYKTPAVLITENCWYAPRVLKVKLEEKAQEIQNNTTNKVNFLSSSLTNLEKLLAGCGNIVKRTETNVESKICNRVNSSFLKLQRKSRKKLEEYDDEEGEVEEDLDGGDEDLNSGEDNEPCTSDSEQQTMLSRRRAPQSHGSDEKDSDVVQLSTISAEKIETPTNIRSLGPRQKIPSREESGMDGNSTYNAPEEELDMELENWKPAKINTTPIAVGQAVETEGIMDEQQDEPEESSLILNEPRTCSSIASGGSTKKGRQSILRGTSRNRMANMSDSHQLFVGNLPHNCTEQDLGELFSTFGKVTALKINQSKPGREGVKVPNFGVIVFDNREAVEKALKENPIFLLGTDGSHRLIVEERRTSQDSMNNSSFSILKSPTTSSNKPSIVPSSHHNSDLFKTSLKLPEESPSFMNSQSYSEPPTNNQNNHVVDLVLDDQPHSTYAMEGGNMQSVPELPSSDRYTVLAETSIDVVPMPNEKIPTHEVENIKESLTTELKAPSLTACQQTGRPLRKNQNRPFFMSAQLEKRNSTGQGTDVTEKTGPENSSNTQWEGVAVKEKVKPKMFGNMNKRKLNLVERAQGDLKPRGPAPGVKGKKINQEEDVNVEPPSHSKTSKSEFLEKLDGVIEDVIKNVQPTMKKGARVSYPKYTSKKLKVHLPDTSENGISTQFQDSKTKVDEDPKITPTTSGQDTMSLGVNFVGDVERGNQLMDI